MGIVFKCLNHPQVIGVKIVGNGAMRSSKRHIGIRLSHASLDDATLPMCVRACVRAAGVRFGSVLGIAEAVTHSHTPPCS
eukprot:1487684-Amphidinium_carterae.1